MWSLVPQSGKRSRKWETAEVMKAVVAAMPARKLSEDIVVKATRNTKVKAPRICLATTTSTDLERYLPTLSRATEADKKVREKVSRQSSHLSCNYLTPCECLLCNLRFTFSRS
jgi:hypothetical protein